MKNIKCDLYAECHRLFSYDAETGLLTRKVAVLARGGALNPKPNCKIGDVVGSGITNDYLRVHIQSKPYLVHRLIWLMQTGELPKKFLDHTNGNKSDNRWVNLREANRAENQWNRGKPSNNTTGYKGVSLSGRKNKPYMVQINADGKKLYLGSFSTPELAHQAYCNKAQELHGEFARLT